MWTRRCWDPGDIGSRGMLAPEFWWSQGHGALLGCRRSRGEDFRGAGILEVQGELGISRGSSCVWLWVHEGPGDVGVRI